MIEPLAAGITIACLVAALVVGVQAVSGAFHFPRIVPTLLVLETALLIQAVIDVVGLLRGHRPSETGAHVAYLVVSLLILPGAAGQTRGEDGRWPGALTAIALVITAVLVIRLQTTWRAAHG